MENEMPKPEEIINQLDKEDLLKMLTKQKAEYEDKLRKKEEEMQNKLQEIEKQKNEVDSENVYLRSQLNEVDEALKASKIFGINMAELPSIEQVAEEIGENPEVLKRNFEKYPQKTIERIQMKVRLEIDNLITDLVDENIDINGDSIMKKLTEMIEYEKRYPDTENIDEDFPIEYKNLMNNIKILADMMQKWIKNSGTIARMQAAVWVAYIHYMAKIGEIDDDEFAPQDEENKYANLLKEIDELKKKISNLEKEKENEEIEKIEEKQKREQEELLERIDSISKSTGAGDEDENPEESEIEKYKSEKKKGILG